MKYLVYETESEAIAADARISASMGYSKPGINALTGEVVPDALTERWDIPQQITTGQWVILSPNGEGVEAEEGWWIRNEDVF